MRLALEVAYNSAYTIHVYSATADTSFVSSASMCSWYLVPGTSLSLSCSATSWPWILPVSRIYISAYIFYLFLLLVHVIKMRRFFSAEFCCRESGFYRVVNIYGNHQIAISIFQRFLKPIKHEVFVYVSYLPTRYIFFFLKKININ